MKASSRTIGEFLVARKVLSRDALEEVLEHERETGIPLTKLLAAEGLVGERDLVAAVSDQIGIPMWDPDHQPIPSIVAGMLPVALCQRLRAVVIGMEGDRLLVAMEDPTDASGLGQLGEETGWNIEPLLAAPSDISLAVEVLYGVEEGT